MTKTLHWYWVRHGPTDSTRLNGWTDVPVILDDQQTIEFLRQYLPKDAIVISSDLQRARHTADAIRGGRPHLLSTERIREINFGRWEGLTTSDIAERDKERAARFWNDPDDASPPDGEQWSNMKARVDGFVDEFCACTECHNIIAVAHYGVILSQIQRARGCKIATLVGCEISNFSLTHLSVKDRKWHLHELNLLPHDVGDWQPAQCL